jgi:hypothetical protein
MGAALRHHTAGRRFEDTSEFHSTLGAHSYMWPVAVVPVQYSLTLDSLGDVLEAAAVVEHDSVDN